LAVDADERAAADQGEPQHRAIGRRQAEAVGVQRRGELPAVVRSVDARRVSLDDGARHGGHFRRAQDGVDDFPVAQLVELFAVRGDQIVIPNEVCRLLGAALEEKTGYIGVPTKRGRTEGADAKRTVVHAHDARRVRADARLQQAVDFVEVTAFGRQRGLSRCRRPVQRGRRRSQEKYARTRTRSSASDDRPECTERKRGHGGNPDFVAMV
jgi:hypothetical protein